MEKYKVVSWRDCHGVETFFFVVNRYGERRGAFASEWEAMAEAKKLNEEAMKAKKLNEEATAQYEGQ